MGTCRSDGKQEAEGERISNCESSDAEHRDGLTSSSCEGAVMVLEPRGQLGQPEGERAMEKDQRTHHKKAKPFIITKREMYAAWLKVKRNQGAGGSLPGGEEVASETGTPQGGVISPLLANLFLHYAFDIWIKKKHPHTPFERYVDDIIVHCPTLDEAERVLEEIRERFAACKLTLHPQKTKIVYCKDSYRRGKNFPNTQYIFLSFLFRPRRMSSKRTNRRFTRFLPGVSPDAKKALRTKVRGVLNRKTVWLSVDELRSRLNPIVRGWLNYFVCYSDLHELRRVMFYVTKRLTNWAQRKYRWGRRRIAVWLSCLRTQSANFFAHWQYNTMNGWTRGAV